ncbi:MAG: tetraacyldisaccharide 4'-kinase [Myxococcota bacterium]
MRSREDVPVATQRSESAAVSGFLISIPRAVASSLYGLGARIHRGQARWTRAGRGRPACAVLSVGGLTVGGAGKTPVAARLALAFQRRGRRVVLASRGYRGRTVDRVTVVSDGRHIHSSVARAGDESLVLAAHAPGVPVLVGRDRRVVAHHAVSRFDAELLVLDDGFQHHRLARDLDLVCIDGIAGLGNRRVLPRGPLREPLSALWHADWLCLVDGEGADWEAELVARFASSGGRVLRAHRRPSSLAPLDHSRREAPSALAGRRVGLLAGVARPGSVRRSLEALGATIVAERLFPDHHNYSATDCASLDPTVPEWVTTEKDALKILPEWLAGKKLSVLSIEIEFEEEATALDAIEKALFENRLLTGSAR